VNTIENLYTNDGNRASYAPSGLTEEGTELEDRELWVSCKDRHLLPMHTPILSTS
jgi:hypothetical protein